MLALIIIAITVLGLLALFDFLGCVSGDKEDVVIFGPHLLGIGFAIIVLSLQLARGAY